MKKRWLNAGAGVWLRKEFVNVDLYAGRDLQRKEGMFCNTKIEGGAEYVQADIRQLPFQDNSFSYVEMMDVIEHLSFRGIVPALQEIHRVMEPEAKLIILTVNMDDLALEWVRMAMQPEFNQDVYLELVQGIFGNQISESELHRCPITPKFLEALLNTAGFREGVMYRLPKGSPVTPVGTLPAQEGLIRLCEGLVAEVVK